MIIGTRSLTLRDDDGDKEIQIRLHAPEKAPVDWVCRFEIDWPEGRAERWGAGMDGIDAVLAALKLIGAEINASDYKKSGRLVWLAPGRGFGFPVPNNIRDLLEGDDARYL